MDNFYFGLSDEDHENADDYNFDHPDALDFDRIYETCMRLSGHEDADIPNYDFASHKRTEEITHLDKSYFILFEGILSLYDERIRDLMDIKIFVQEDDDVRLARRIRRDTRERGRTVTSVLSQWHKTVKPSFDEFIKPAMKYSDIIVNGNAGNKNAIQFIVDNLAVKLTDLGIASKQALKEESIKQSRIVETIHHKLPKGLFDSLVTKLTDEPEFEEIYLVYFIKKLKEFYEQDQPTKIVLLDQLNKKTSSKTGNLHKSPIKTLTVFVPSLLETEEINLACDSISMIDEQYSQVDILTLFGNQPDLKELFLANNLREDLLIDVFSLGSTPLLHSHEINTGLANHLFEKEFK